MCGIYKRELKIYKKRAKDAFSYTDEGMKGLLKKGTFIEVL
jgi:hypothetical protein